MTAAAGLAVAAIAVVLFLPSHELSSPDSARQPSRAVTAAADNAEGALTRRLAEPADEIRSVGLDDGSVVTLDKSSAVAIAFTPDKRRLTLVRGRERFTVAHVGRPFVVFDNGRTVTARGTVIDNTIENRVWREDVSPVKKRMATDQQ